MNLYKDKGEPLRLSDAFAYRRAFRFWIATAKGHKAAYAAMRQRAEEAAERVVFWKGESEALRLQKDSYAESLKALRFERDAAIARAERVEDINKRLFNACRERNTRISDLTQRAERVEAQLAELDSLLLGSLAALGIPTPVEGYRAAGWSFLKGDIKRAIKAKGLVEEALLRCQRLADDGVDDPAGPYNVLAQIANTVAAVLSSPPADASTMAGEREEKWGALVENAYDEGFCDGQDGNPDAGDRAWLRSRARAALAEMEQKS